MKPQGFSCFRPVFPMVFPPQSTQIHWVWPLPPPHPQNPWRRKRSEGTPRVAQGLLRHVLRWCFKKSTSNEAWENAGAVIYI